MSVLYLYGQNLECRRLIVVLRKKINRFVARDLEYIVSREV